MDVKEFGDIVDSLNSIFQNGITLSNNLSGQIVEFEVPASGAEVKVSHKLGTIPKFRIVLRQDAITTLVDGAETWTNKFVTFRSSGGEATKFIVLLLRN